MINHIGFIMDGNRRYAKKMGLSYEQGYKIGMEQFLNVVNFCIKNNIKHCSFFSMSKDNLEKRDKNNLKPIKDLAKQFFENKEIETFFKKNNIIIKLKGKYADNALEKVKEKDNGNIPEEDMEFLEILDKKHKEHNQKINNPKFYVHIAINYDGQEEISNACNNLIQKGETKITPEKIKNELYFNDTPPAEVIVRPGNAPRTSGFLLFDSKYSEIYLTEKLWPELTDNDLKDILDWYSKQQRNFGK